jgi:hypothetical protein
MGYKKKNKRGGDTEGEVNVKGLFNNLKSVASSKVDAIKQNTANALKKHGEDVGKEFTGLKTDIKGNVANNLHLFKQNYGIKTGEAPGAPAPAPRAAAQAPTGAAAQAPALTGAPAPRAAAQAPAGVKASTGAAPAPAAQKVPPKPIVVGGRRKRTKRTKRSKRTKRKTSKRKTKKRVRFA